MKKRSKNILQNNIVLIILTLFTIFSLCQYLVDNDIKNFTFLMLIMVLLSNLTDNLIIILCVSILLTNLLIDIDILEGAEKKKKKKKKPEKTPEEIKKETETNLYSLFNSQNRDIPAISQAIIDAENAGWSSNTLQILEDARSLVNSLKPTAGTIGPTIVIEKEEEEDKSEDKKTKGSNGGILDTIKGFFG